MCFCEHFRPKITFFNCHNCYNNHILWCKDFILYGCMYIFKMCAMKSKQTVWQWNVHFQQSTGQRSGSEDNHVNSLHSVYKRRGKYSTSSEFKTQMMWENPQMAFFFFFFLFLNTNQLETTIITLIFFWFFFFSEQAHILPGDAGSEWEQYYPEHTHLLDSLGDYCSSIFYDKSHSLESMSTPLSTHWMRVYICDCYCQ